VDVATPTKNATRFSLFGGKNKKTATTNTDTDDHEPAPPKKKNRASLLPTLRARYTIPLEPSFPPPSPSPEAQRKARLAQNAATRRRILAEEGDYVAMRRQLKEGLDSAALFDRLYGQLEESSALVLRRARHVKGMMAVRDAVGWWPPVAVGEDGEGAVGEVCSERRA
jgi:hypothetical protein